MLRVKTTKRNVDEFGVKIPSTEELERLAEACAVSKLDKMHDVATKSALDNYDEAVLPAGLKECDSKELPKDVTQLDAWVGLINELRTKYGFPARVLLHKLLPRTARMMSSKDSEGFRSQLEKKLVQCIYDIESPTTIEQIMREYQHELRDRPTRNQLKRYAEKILKNRGERPNGKASIIKMDIDTTNYLVSVSVKPAVDALARTVGSMYLYENGGTVNRKKVMLTSFGKYDVKPDDGVLSELNRHGIIWWGLNASSRKIFDASGMEVSI